MPDRRSLATLPDSVLRPGPLPGDRRPRLVATGFGGSVRSSFSGSSGYLADAGIDNGTLDGAFTLFSDRAPDRVLQVKGALWKVQRLLHRQSSGGYKFSGDFSAHLWRRHLPALAGTDVINNFQLFSDEFFRRRAEYDVRAFFYLDGTLHDYLRGYREYDVAAVDAATVDRALEVERRGYHQADGIAVMSEAAARTLVAEYGLARDQVTVVLPGANLTDGMAEQVVARRAGRPQPDEFVLGFVGVYPERKGLPKLAAAVTALRAEGVPVRLRVVGRCPDDIAALDGVEALGYISKTDDPDRFVAALSGMDLGCLLSTVELSGIAVLEFLRCGIPVLATDVGGLPDNLQGGGGITVARDASTADVAGAIRRFITNTGERQRLIAEAEGRRSFARWHRTAASLGDLVAGHTGRDSA